MASQEAAAGGEAAPVVSDYVRVKRKMTSIFLYAELAVDTVHDLRVREHSLRGWRRWRLPRYF